MPSKKQQACVTRYVAAHYDKITITVYKGEREKIKAIAAAAGLSTAELIRRAVSEFASSHGLQIERDGDAGDDTPSGSE